MSEDALYSIVIPVYNSARLLPELVARLDEFFVSRPLKHEIIFVNDGSSDDSLAVLEELKAGREDMVVIDLVKNYGQHSALHCGFAEARGDFVVTMDDDLQNPPAEIGRLIDRMAEGDIDVVFGRFRRKRHAAYRRLGARLIDWINQRVFGKPKDLVLTNFRLISRRTIDAVLTYRTQFPYVTGLLLICGGRFANVEVDHHPRPLGRSNYNWPRLLKLVWRIVIGYSSWLLRAACLAGAIMAGLGFLIALFVLVKAVLVGTSVPGWASLTLLLSAFQGVTMAILWVFGEYIVRIVGDVSGKPAYFIRRKL